MDDDKLEKASDEEVDENTDAEISDSPKDYYFLPQPWLTEAGKLKTSFFMHLVESTCAMISRLSGSSMHRLASEHRHLLSHTSFRSLCFVRSSSRLFIPSHFS